MSKRARYTGNPPGRVIAWPPGEVHPEKTWFVQPNHWLPEDVPAKLRDELLATPDFTEVEESTPSKPKGDK
jgi:hypothetical protein